MSRNKSVHTDLMIVNFVFHLMHIKKFSPFDRETELHIIYIYIFFLSFLKLSSSFENVKLFHFKYDLYVCDIHV